MNAPGVVVADTTPLNYLIMIDRAEMLASLNDLRQTTFRATPELLGRFEARMKARRG